jgi:hypothetical protein
MPNWCSNSFEVQGTKEQIDKFEAFLEKGDGKNWFDFFLPTPAELSETDSSNRDEEVTNQLLEKYGAADWYSWNINNWGCKWNCDAQDWTRSNDNAISFWFDSPWGPPTALYEHITSDSMFDGMEVSATYFESGMCFVGQFVDGSDEYYEYSDLESLDDIPESLVDEYGIREMLEEQSEFDEEDENE